MKKFYAVWTFCVLSATAAFADDLSRKQLDRTIDEALTIIEKKFMKPVTREELVERALKLLLKDLDPYSNYLNPRERADFAEFSAAAFGGFGVNLEWDEAAKVPRIRYLMVDSPAREAGVQRGDRLVRIDGHDVTGWPIEKTMGIMRGKPDTVAEVQLRRDGASELLPLRITRRLIGFPSVRGARRDAQGKPEYLLDETSRVGYIRIQRLAKDTVAVVDAAMAELTRLGATAVVLDLRDCVGGMLDAAVGTADLFIDGGRLLTVASRNDSAVYDAKPGKYTSIPMAVLINGGTASSGEILAGALKDHARGVFLGERTWGKGRVQVLFSLGDGLGQLMLSTGTFQRPSGKTIDRHDVPEGYEIALSKEEHKTWFEHAEKLDGAVMLTAEEQKSPAPDRVLEAALKALAAKTASSRLAPPVRRVAERTDQQRYVVVLRRVADDEGDRRLRIKSVIKIRTDIEYDFVDARRDRVGHARAAIGVGRDGLQQRLAVPELHLDPRARPAAGRVEHVRGHSAHHSTSFHNRSCMILRCSSAATRSSVSASLVSRCQAMASISSPERPVAQTM